jgi:uncharacterized protein (TIGR03083 family)
MIRLPLAPAAYLPHLIRQLAEFEHLLRTADLDAPVESCGDWRLRELGVHLGDVHQWATAIVTTGEPSPQKFDSKPGDDLADWYAAKAAELLQALRDADPAARSWHFLGTEKVNAFWYRRQTQEVAVHLFDAARAAGTEAVIDPVIAADGVDEVFTAMMPRVRRWHTPPPLPEPLLLRATDTGHAWLLRPASEAGEIPTAHQAAGEEVSAATAEASAQDLLLLLWKRRTIAEAAPRIIGDESVAHGFLTAPLTP